MQIRVQCACGESSCPEWAVVELQGVVQPQASFAGDIRGLHIGRLCSSPSPASASSKARQLILTRRLLSLHLVSWLPWMCSFLMRLRWYQAGFTFTVGYHELAGTKVTLKKPLLVLRKKKVNAGTQEEEPPTAAEVELEVIGIIRHKILFKDRPKALISSNPLPSPPVHSPCLGSISKFYLSNSLADCVTHLLQSRQPRRRRPCSQQQSDATPATPCPLRI